MEIKKLRGTFPDLFREYYDEMDSGKRDPRGFVIKDVTKDDRVCDNWLQTGVGNGVQSDRGAK